MRKHNELWDLIKEKGYNCLRLARKLGYSDVVVYDWTYGTREPCAMDMIRLSDVLKVPVERIVRIVAGA
jgi:hypothetical protein